MKWTSERSKAGFRLTSLVSISLCLVLMMLLAAACSKGGNNQSATDTTGGTPSTSGQGASASNQENSKKPIKISVYAQVFTPTEDSVPTEKTPLPRVALDKIAADFTKLHPNITVEVLKNVPVDDQTWHMTRIASGDAPDVAYMSMDAYDKGWLLPLDEYFDKPNPFVEGNEKWSDVFNSPELIKRKQDGHIYEVPIVQEVGAPTTIYYNIDIFEELNLAVPKSWNEFLDVLRKVQEAGYIATVPAVQSNGPTLWPLDSVTKPLTTKLIDDFNYSGAATNAELKGDEIVRAIKQGIISMDRPEFREAWMLYKEWSKTWAKGWNTQDMSQLWRDGKVAIREGGMWELQSELSDTERKFKWGVFPVPVAGTDSSEYAVDFPRVKGNEANQGPTFVMSVVKPSVEKNNTTEAAVLFLQYLTSPQVNEYLVNEIPFGRPSVKSTATLPLFDALMEAEFVKFPQITVPMPAWLSNEVYDTVNRNAALWFNNGIKDDQFFAEVQKALMNGADEAIKSQKLDTSNW